MFGKKPNGVDQQHEAAMARVLDDMEMFGPGTEKYQELLNQLTALKALPKERKPRWSGDTLIMAGANLLITGVVVAYEQKHVLTTKAQQFHLKGK